MANHTLAPLTPLASTTPRVDTIGSVTISENVDCALASLTIRNGKTEAFNKAAQSLFGKKLPTTGKQIRKGDYTAFWTMSEQWFIEAPMASHEDIAAILQEAFADNASITEQSGGWVRFDLQGTGSIATLERLFPLDVAVMEKSTAHRSTIEHIGVYVVCQEKATSFSIYGPRSMADSLHHALTTSAQSVAHL